MQDMKLEEIEKKDFVMPNNNAPKYPYGLKLTLTCDQLKKIGINEIPDMDEKLMFDIKTEVVEIELIEGEGDEKKHRVEFQITAIGLMEMDDKEKEDKKERMIDKADDKKEEIKKEAYQIMYGE